MWAQPIQVANAILFLVDASGTVSAVTCFCIWLGVVSKAWLLTPKRYFLNAKKSLILWTE